MREYLVINCPSCGNLLLASSDSKTRKCPYCGAAIRLSETKIYGRSANAQKARETLRALKFQKSSTDI